MTRKHISLKFIAGILLSAGTVSCDKYLDIKPYGETIPRTADEFSSLLHSRLEEIDYGEEVIIGDIGSAIHLECYSDNFEASLTSYPNGNFIPLYIGTSLSSKQTLYKNLYEVIRDCNITIDNLEERDTRLGKDVLGTAYAMRGICWYNLLRNFCEPCIDNMQGLGVPLVTAFDMEEKPLRSTIAQTFTQAEADMKKAIEYGIEDPIFRFNSDVMEGYLARLYFWTGNWSDAITYAQKVLDKYPLVSGAAYLEMMQSEISAKGNMIIKSCILSESSSNTQYSGEKSYMRSRPISKRFIDTFEDGDKDVRYGLSFNKKREFTKNAFGCLRSAEMQLILAESLYHSGRQEDALEALNQLRRLRIDGVTDYTMETLPQPNPDEYITEDVYGNPLTPLLNAILNERRKELFMEGDRWFELKRNGRPEFWAAKQGRKYTTMKFMYTFPLPISDIELVDGLIQNPGYDKMQ